MINFTVSSSPAKNINRMESNETLERKYQEISGTESTNRCLGSLVHAYRYMDQRHFKEKGKNIRVIYPETG